MEIFFFGFPLHEMEKLCFTLEESRQDKNIKEFSMFSMTHKEQETWIKGEISLKIEKKIQDWFAAAADTSFVFSSLW